MTTWDRIKEDAELACKNTITAMNDTETIAMWEGYITGAKSERNKTIEEAIDVIKGQGPDGWQKLYTEKLNSLKI